MFTLFPDPKLHHNSCFRYIEEMMGSEEAARLVVDRTAKTAADVDGQSKL
jgi:hypothetical protein